MLAFPGVAPVAELAEIGVTRISVGSAFNQPHQHVPSMRPNTAGRFIGPSAPRAWMPSKEIVLSAWRNRRPRTAKL